MRLSPTTVATFVISALVWAGPVCSAQSEATTTASGAQAAPVPASDIQPSAKVIPAPPPVASSAAPADKTDVTKPSTEPKSAAGRPADSQKRYVIGALDVLYIKVWNQPQLSGPVDVRPDGILSMPLIGEVKADGLTAAQLKDAVEKRLNDFLNNPEVDVQIAKVNSKRYFVYGGVLKPGEFPLVEATTIMDALSQVGGFKDFAKPNKITIQRGNQTFHFNYKDFSKGKNMDKNVNIEIENGDRIYVPE